MHMEPGIVDSTKIALSYVTATGALGFTTKLALDAIKQAGIASLLLRAAVSTALVFCFFEVLPHHAIGISEVHLILGSTLMLVFGPAAGAIGLAAGLLMQGLFFAPFDLPQYGMNVTTLLVPLFATAALAQRIVPAHTAYVDIRYSQALKLSTAYQGGIVLWVAFWAFYGRGFGAANLAEVASFGAAYMTVVLVEPLVDLAVLACAKWLHTLKDSRWVEKRLYHAAA